MLAFLATAFPAKGVGTPEFLTNRCGSHQLMLKRASILVGIVAILLGGGAPAVGSCVLDASLSHSCCDPPRREVVETCCAASAGSEADIGDVSCRCARAPDVAAVIASPAPALEHNDASGLGPSSIDLDAAAAPVARRLRLTTELRSLDPPPPFLLGCSFLI
jgi:hypothetical protein